MSSKMSNRVSKVAKSATNKVSKSMKSLKSMKPMKSMKSMNPLKSMKSMKSMNPEHVVIGVLLLILVVLVIYYVRQNNSENFESEQEPVVLYLFFVDWCPHCKTAKPKLAELEKQLAAKDNKVKGRRVEVRLVNCEGTEEEKELAQRNDVKAYPSVVLEKDGDKIEFEQGVSVEGLNNFLVDNL